MLVKSMGAYGFTNPILALKDGMVVAGHGRLLAAKQAGLAEVPVIRLDMPYEKAVQYVIADNRLAEIANTDEKILAELVAECMDMPDFDIEAIGYTLDDMSGEEEEPVFTLDDFEFNELEEPCWFVIRGNIEDYEAIKNHIIKLGVTVDLKGSLDGETY